VGAFKNAGRRWQPRGAPTAVQVHDFPHLGEGKAIAYGTYDVAQDQALVNVGVSHDTAQFASRASGAGGACWAGAAIRAQAGC